MKYITLITIILIISTSAQANKRFMQLKPNEHTIIPGHNFMGLGGGQDPLRIAKTKEEFRTLKRYIAPLPSIRTSTKEKESESLEPIKHQIKTITKNDPTAVDHFWPVDENAQSKISSNYGYRTHPITGKYSFHNGLDIAAPEGTPTIASASGIVTEASSHKNLGNYVKIKHNNGSHSIYGHLSKITIQEGSTVKKGQKIGEVGSTGRSTGPHLHYSIKKDGKHINPLTELSRNNNKNIALK